MRALRHSNMQRRYLGPTSHRLQQMSHTSARDSPTRTIVRLLISAMFLLASGQLCSVAGSIERRDSDSLNAVDVISEKTLQTEAVIKCQHESPHKTPAAQMAQPPPSVAHDLQVSSNSQGKLNSTPVTATNNKLANLSAVRSKCWTAERELDRCSAQLIGLGQSAELVYPDSVQELNGVYCPKFKETLGCIKNSTECYRPFERQVINWVLTSTRKMNHKRCKNENEKVRFLKLTHSCLATMRNPMDDCMSRYIGQLDAIADYNRDLERLTEDDLQIQLSCCANKRFKQCVMNSARRGCQQSHENLNKLRRTNSLSSQRVARKQLQRAIQDTMDDLKSTLNEMSLTGPEFICTGIDEQFCRARFDGRYSNSIARHKSIVPSMIRIYANR